MIDFDLRPPRAVIVGTDRPIGEGTHSLILPVAGTAIQRAPSRSATGPAQHGPTAELTALRDRTFRPPRPAPIALHRPLIDDLTDLDERACGVGALDVLQELRHPSVGAGARG